MSKEKIIVVDMVNGFIKKGPLHDKKIMQIVEPIKELLNSKNDANITVLEDSHVKNAAEFINFPEHCIEGTYESKTIDELQYLINGDQKNKASVIKKNSTNGYFNLHLKNELIGVNTIYLVGCCTDICVLHLALTLKTHDNENNSPKRIIVVSDCVATYDAPNHNAEEYTNYAFKLMKVAGIEIMTKEEVLNETK